MAKYVNHVMIFRTAPGLRMTTSYCEIEDGAIVKDNIRTNRILTDAADVEKAEALLALAQSYLEEA